MHRVIGAAVLTLVVLLCSGCEDTADIQIVSGGVIVDPDKEFDYESFFEQIYRDSAHETVIAENILPVTEPAPTTETEAATVYWTKSGEVWHVSANCSSLSRSKNIHSGDIPAAEASGKTRACKRCS